MNRDALEPGRGLALVGYRGTGKSSVGRLVAARLGRPFFDADLELEARAGRPIREIFAEDGEAAFRDLEQAVLADLCTRPGIVLACGGGAVIRPSNRESLRRLGFVAWLTAPPEELARRLRADRRGLAVRPALTAAGTLEEIRSVLAERTPLYEAAADAAVETLGRSTRQVATAVVAAWRAHAPGVRAVAGGGGPEP